jgi:hypothetical protein
MVNCDFGAGSNIAVLSSKTSWENVICNYDHIYIRFESGRPGILEAALGIDNSVYYLFLSNGPWPLVWDAGTGTVLGYPR